MNWIKTRRALAPSFGVIGLFAALLALPLAGNAAGKDHTQNNVVALEFDVPTKTLFAATPGGLSLSKDEGKTWTTVAAPKAAAKGKIAAVTAAAGGKKSFYLAGPGIGVLRTKDGGRSWTGMNKGLPSTDVVALSAHAEQPETVYAYVEGKGIFRSQDAGANWRLMDRGPREEITHFVHSNMPGSMETGWLFAATGEGVRRSMDCFCGWHRAGELSGKVHAVSYDPDEPQRVYAATQQGLFVTQDGGEEWKPLKGPESTVTALVAAPGGKLYAAGNGRLFRSSDRGLTWEPLDAA